MSLPVRCENTFSERAAAQLLLIAAGLWSLRCALRQLWGVDVVHRYLSRQRIHPDFNRLHLGVSECDSTLMNRHVADRLVQRRNRAVMEVWSRLLDVPQGGDLEDHLVVLLLGHLVDPLIGLVEPRFHNYREPPNPQGHQSRWPVNTVTPTGRDPDAARRFTLAT